MITPADHPSAARRGSSTVRQYNRRAALILPVAAVLIATVLEFAATHPVPLIAAGFLLAPSVIGCALLRGYWAVRDRIIRRRPA